MRKFRETVKEFEYYITIEKNYSYKTNETYLKNLNDFYKYLEIKFEYEPNIDSVTKEHLKEYLMYLKLEKNNKPSTINNKISTLKSFYNFLCAKGYIKIDNNITLNVKLQKLPKLLPIYLSYEEAETLLLGIKLLSNNPTRDYAILCTYLLTGARLSEIVNLHIDQINFSNKSMTIMGKGSKERTIPVVDRVFNALQDYLNVSQDTIIKPRKQSVDTHIVFLNRYGKPLTENGMQAIITDMMKKTGVYRKGLSTHKLRHTCFTLLHKAGVDILKIQRMAGHENIKSTAIYTHINEKDLYSSMQMNPLNANGYADAFIEKIKERYTRQ